MRYIKTKIGIYDIDAASYYLLDGSVKRIPYCPEYELDPSSCEIGDTLSEIGFPFKIIDIGRKWRFGKPHE